MERALVRRTVADDVADRLRAEILAGELKPGERLLQAQVAQRLGVSTTPVREALSLLQAQGLVASLPHRGVVVSVPTAADVIECYEMRIPLEALAVERAIPNLNEAQVRRLQSILDQMVKTRNLDRWAQLNGRFHGELYEASGRRRLCETIAALRAASRPFVRLHLAAYPHETAQDEHQEILDACAAGDSPAADDAIKRHLQHTVGGIVELLGDSD